MIFSAYRRDDFADPDSFVLQLAMVLEAYPDAIVGDVCSPRTGVQRHAKFPPSIAEVVTACEGESERRAKIAKYAALPRAALLPRPDSKEPGRRANLFAPANHPRYQAFCDRARNNADPADYRFDTARGGIWVSLVWDDEFSQQAARGPRRFTMQDLRDLDERVKLSEAAE